MDGLHQAIYAAAAVTPPLDSNATSAFLASYTDASSAVFRGFRASDYLDAVERGERIPHSRCPGHWLDSDECKQSDCCELGTCGPMLPLSFGFCAGRPADPCARDDLARLFPSAGFEWCKIRQEFPDVACKDGCEPRIVTLPTKFPAYKALHW